jgi:hypothetical protein
LRLSASDVANFLACGHLTRLDLLRARGELHPPYQVDTGFEDLVRRGDAHERAVLDWFRTAGYSIAEIEYQPDAEAVRATMAATRDGADVVYQGVLTLDPASRKGPVLWTFSSGRICCKRRTVNHALKGCTMRSSTPSSQGPRRLAPSPRSRSTPTC